MFPTLIYQLNININSHKVWDKDQILFCLKWYNSYKYQYYNIFFHHANYVIQQDKCLKNFMSYICFVSGYLFSFWSVIFTVLKDKHI